MVPLDKLSSEYSLEQIAGNVSAVSGLRGGFLTALAGKLRSSYDEQVYGSLLFAGSLLSKYDGRTDRNLQDVQTYVDQVANQTPENITLFLGTFYEKFTALEPKQQEVQQYLARSAVASTHVRK